MFFADAQNKIIFAVTQKTAAELIVERADAKVPNMAVQSWKGKIVRKQDIYIAKNYLSEDEIDTLNRLVVVFLEAAELRIKGRKDITMDYWQINIDKIIEFAEKPILKDNGSISNEHMKQLVGVEYEKFDQRRKEFDALEADRENLEELQVLEATMKRESTDK